MKKIIIFNFIFCLFLLNTFCIFARDGGPDQFGYFWTDNLYPKAPDAPDFSNSLEGWEADFSTDNSVNLLNDDATSDETNPPIPIGFDFIFYGETYSYVVIASNGFIGFTKSATTWEANFTGLVLEESCLNDENCKADDCDQGYCILKVPLPDSRYPAMIAAFLTDLDPSIAITNETGGVYYEVREIAGADEGWNEYLLITYYNIPDTEGAFPVSFQIKLFEGTNRVIVAYNNVPSNGKWHVAGIQDPTGYSGLVFDFSTWLIMNTSVWYAFPILPPAYGLFANDEKYSAQYGKPGSDVKLESDFPAFSAIFDNTDMEDSAWWYKIQVATTETFESGTIRWDTYPQCMATEQCKVVAGQPDPVGIGVGQRTADMLYLGPALEAGKKYYWRITFWDKLKARTTTPYNSENSFCVTACEESSLESTTSGGGGGGTKCFISSAVYSPDSKETITFKWLRDKYLIHSTFGKSFVKLYYKYGPHIAEKIEGSKFLKHTSNLAIYPLYIITNFFLFVENFTKFIVLIILSTCIIGILILKSNWKPTKIEVNSK